MTSIGTASAGAVFAGRQLRSTLSGEGVLTVELVDHEWAAPTGSQILVKVEAAPINPSDLGLLFGPADTENAEYSPGRVVARVSQGAVQALRARHGLSLPAGNEGAGTVVAAGEDPSAQALLGKRVAAVPGTAYGTYAHAEARMSLPLPDDVSAEQGASSFVNPMTALGFVETMRAEGFIGLVHAAAASNLGQMLVRICREDGVPLVNIVRSQAQVELLQGLGAKYVLDSTDPAFTAHLAEAIGETGAMLGFDPIGGGTMAGRILTAMEAAASRGAAYSPYGSSTPKRVYIYGGLDAGPTILHRSFGLTWDLGGWLLFPFVTKAGPAVVTRMRERVMRDLTTTFASHYSDRVSLERMLTQEAVSRYTARRTGEKYLVLPNG
ncbi:zinc-binding dehydrogenase [Intrasporangium calvum]|uniref:Alcohol dehydrogenase GroES domain protein n=1 Tax=Intrasporangium calvum (strain ATCC 23552 / DSM 43043 / JCM 3097 / NBRC 12989 / NCIMB 10167 / NRRL B-3866 / 7 KIP) TaxID=710696 RepID=E6SG17_INTC7|nr:zinc-binding dehydrogenase [Intrasporangium calvum]ADU49971.1 Alcohol dehydrogenase GroES domain protein [Intrasporangium calvum DSM 43043]AXG15505.1 NADH oxidase [Intrasporangium calvum]